MLSKTMSDWFDSFDDDQPTPDGAWANAWAPVFDGAATRRAEMTHEVVMVRPVVMAAPEAQTDLWMGGALNHG